MAQIVRDVTLTVCGKDILMFFSHPFRKSAPEEYMTNLIVPSKSGSDPLGRNNKIL